MKTKEDCLTCMHYYYCYRNQKSLYEGEFARAQLFKEVLKNGCKDYINENSVVVDPETCCTSCNLATTSLLESIRKDGATKLYENIHGMISVLDFETDNNDYDRGFFDACKEILNRLNHIAKIQGVNTEPSEKCEKCIHNDVCVRHSYSSSEGGTNEIKRVCT